MSSDFGESTKSASPPNSTCCSENSSNKDVGDFECNICFDSARDPVVTLCGHLFCWPCLYRWLHHRSRCQGCPVCKALVEEDKLVPLYGKGKLLTDQRIKSYLGMEIPPRPSGQRPQTDAIEDEEEEFEEDDEEIEDEQYYQPEAPAAAPEVQSQQYQIPDHLQQQAQRLEEYALRMASWVTDIATNLCLEPPNFSPDFQALFDEFRHHTPVPNLRQRFVTQQQLENYFANQNQTMTNGQNQMRATWIRQNQEYDQMIADMRNFEPFDRNDL